MMLRVKSDGSVISWGSSYCGGDSSTVSSNLTNVSTIYSTFGAFAAIVILPTDEVPNISSCQDGYKLTSFWSASGHSKKCIPCPAGRYSSQDTSECLKCSAGKYAMHGSSFCRNCSAGYYSLENAADCNICPAGRYSPEGSSNCTQCARSEYSYPGSSSCLGCSANWYYDNNF